MIREYAADIAAQMGIKLSSVTLTEGRQLGCFDAHLLSLCANDRLVSEFIHQSDLDSLQNGSANDLLELKVRSSLARLKIMLEP